MTQKIHDNFFSLSDKNQMKNKINLNRNMNKAEECRIGVRADLVLKKKSTNRKKERWKCDTGTPFSSDIFMPICCQIIRNSVLHRKMLHECNLQIISQLG